MFEHKMEVLQFLYSIYLADLNFKGAAGCSFRITYDS